MGITYLSLNWWVYRSSEPSTVARWWFQIFLIFTPIWGRFPIWLYNIFRMGWNHQEGRVLNGAQCRVLKQTHLLVASKVVPSSIPWALPSLWLDLCRMPWRPIMKRRSSFPGSLKKSFGCAYVKAMGCSKFRRHFCQSRGFFRWELGWKTLPTNFPDRGVVFCELPHSKDLFRGKYGDVKVVKRKSLPKMMQHFTYLEMVNKKNTYYISHVIYILHPHHILVTIFIYNLWIEYRNPHLWCHDLFPTDISRWCSIWAPCEVFQAVLVVFIGFFFHVRNHFAPEKHDSFSKHFFSRKKSDIYILGLNQHIWGGSLPKDPTPKMHFLCKNHKHPQVVLAATGKLPLSFSSGHWPAKSWRNVKKMAMQVSLACHFTILLPSGRQEVLSIPQEWLVGWLVGWSVGRSVGWLVGWLVGRSVGRLVGWLVGWRVWVWLDDSIQPMVKPVGLGPGALDSDLGSPENWIRDWDP